MMKLLIFALTLGAVLLDSSFASQITLESGTRRAKPTLPALDDSTVINDASASTSSFTKMVSTTPMAALSMSIAAIYTPLSHHFTTGEALSASKEAQSPPKEASYTPATILTHKEEPTGPIIASVSSPPPAKQLPTSLTLSVVTIYGILSQVNDATDDVGVLGVATKTIATTIAITLSPGQLFSTTSISGIGLVGVMTDTYLAAITSGSAARVAPSDLMAPNSARPINISNTSSKPNLPSQAAVGSTPSDGNQDLGPRYNSLQLNAASIAGIITGILAVSIAVVVGANIFWRKLMSHSHRPAETGFRDITELPVEGHVRYELPNAHLRIELPISLNQPVELRADESVGSLPEKLGASDKS